MKTRIISMLLTIVMILACFSGCDSLIGDGNTAAECQHKDANDDNLCDKCGNDFSDGKDQVTPQCNHRDADDNFKCDKCGALYTDGNETGGGATKCEHKDSNGDDICDYCHRGYTDPNKPPECEHRDADDDGLCDKCGVYHGDGDDLPSTCFHFNKTEPVEESKEPTCEEDGFFKETWSCVDCGENFVGRNYIIPAKGHGPEVGYCYNCYELDPGVHLSDDNPYEIKTYDGFKYIYFGEYPQSLKKDDVTITSTQDARGYYLGSDGYYYAKVTASVKKDEDISFEWDVEYLGGETYYFKVLPIRWKILEEKDGNALIFCDSILTYTNFQPNVNVEYGFESREYWYLSQSETIYANAYAYSTLRSWLNNQFYDNYFSDIQKELILTTTLDANASQSDIDKGYISIEDKIFLPDASDYVDQFGHLEKLITMFTNNSDYAKAMSGLDYGSFWFRSPYSRGDREYGSSVLCYSSDHKNYGYSSHTDTYQGVAPMLWIKLQ